MRKIRIVEITLVCLIIFSYFIPFIGINVLGKQAVSMLNIVFDPNYSSELGGMTGFLFIPIIASIIAIMVNSAKYPFVSFLTGISVVFGIAPITASRLYSFGGEPSAGLILMAFAGVMLLLSGLFRGCWYYKKNWIFLTCIVGIAVIPALFNQYMLFLTLVMAYTLFPIMGITILISFLVNRKNGDKTTETKTTSEVFPVAIPQPTQSSQFLSVEQDRKKKKLLLGGMIAAGIIIAGVFAVIFISGGKEAASQLSEVAEEEMEKNPINKIALFPNYTYEFKGKIGGRYPVTMTLITNRDLQTMVNYSYDKDGTEHIGSPYIQFDGHTLNFSDSDSFGNTTIVEGNATDSVTITGTWRGGSINKELSFTLKMVHSETYVPKAIVALPPPPVPSSVEEVLEITAPEPIPEPTPDPVPVEVEHSLKQAEESDKNAVLEVAETMPEFSGGQAALQSYLAGNLKYPKEAIENGITGRVVIAFIVGLDGSINDVRVIRSVSPELDKEALRVVNGMPHWKPGTQKGEPVRVKHTMPIMFRLQ